MRGRLPDDRHWPRFSLAWALAAMSILCVLFAAYHAWGLDALLLWWLVIVTATIMLLGRRDRPVWAMAISIAATVPLMWLVVRDARGPSSRVFECRSNLAMLALAYLNYESNYKRLPQVSTRLANGEPGLSWRVSLLPFIEEETLYQTFNLNEAWDGPANNRFIDSMPSTYRCPEDRSNSKRYTNYLAFAGAHTLWPANEPLTEPDIVDGASNTILFAEMHDSGITWSEPRDFDADKMDWRIDGTPRSSPSSMHAPAVEYFDGSRHRRGASNVNVVMADRSVRTFAADADPEVLKQLANPRDGLPTPSDMPAEVPLAIPD